MAIKLILSSDKIRDEVFPHAPRGYNALVVDQFLDTIISDYKEMEANYLLTKEEVDAMKNEIESLKAENNKLTLENASFKNKFQNINETDNVSIDNIDLIKRINVLEKFLWNHGFNPLNIK